MFSDTELYTVQISISIKAVVEAQLCLPTDLCGLPGCFHWVTVQSRVVAKSKTFPTVPFTEKVC